MKRKILKITISILILAAIFVLFSQNSFAFGFDISTKFQNTQDKGNTTNTVSTMVGKVINAAQVIGAGVAIVMLVVLGIRWIGDSPEGKAQIAKSAKYYIAGAIFIFSAIALVQIIKNFTQNSLVKSV